MNISPTSIPAAAKKSPQNAEKFAADKQQQKLKDACADFEALLIQSMLKSMRDTLPGDALFEKSMQQDIFQSLHDQELSVNIAKGNNNLGIGDALFNQLKGPERESGPTGRENKSIDKNSSPVKRKHNNHRTTLESKLDDRYK